MQRLISKIKSIKPFMLVRYIVLLAILIFVTTIGFMHQLSNETTPSVDALCPFGGLESLANLLFKGTLINQIYTSSVILFIITIVIVLITGRSFCGWICPLGTLQGIMNGIRNFFFKKKTGLLQNQDKYARYIKYLVLVGFIAATWYGGKLFLRPYDPWVVWMHISNLSDVINEFPIGLIVLVITLVGALFISRPFCRYLCPMGGFLALFGKISLFKIKRDTKTCIDCGICDRSCPVGIDISKKEKISAVECISCGECTLSCNKTHSLDIHVAGKKTNPLIIGIITLVILFGIVGITQVTGIYKSIPVSVKEMKEAGNITPEEIKGYMTLDDVSSLFKIELSNLYKALNLDPAVVPKETALKDVSKKTGEEFDPDSVREIVAEILAQSSATLTAPTHIPKADSTTSMSPDSISGLMTLKEVAEAFNIKIDILYKKLGITLDKVPVDTPCRDLTKLVSSDFHTTKVREAVAELIKK